MKASHILIVILVALAASYGGTKLALRTDKTAPQITVAETAYERIVRTQTLRCGYIPYGTAFRIDPNTKIMSGLFYELMNEIGKIANIKIDWVEELTWATLSTAIQSGRVDVLCSGMWADTQNGKFVGYTQPLFFNTISAYGRVDETRFQTPEALDDPSVRVVSRDGSTSGIIKTKDFPKATLISLPGTVTDADQMEFIITNKADIIFYGDDIMADYIKTNPGKLKMLFPDHKFRTYPTVLAFPITDVALAQLLNSAIGELKGMGVIDNIASHYISQSGWQPAALK